MLIMNLANHKYILFFLNKNKNKTKQFYCKITSELQMVEKKWLTWSYGTIKTIISMFVLSFTAQSTQQGHVEQVSLTNHTFTGQA